VKRRVFLAGFQAQLVSGRTSRNDIWRQFVPLVKDISARLTALQDYMIGHQKEVALATLDRTFLSNLDGCIEDLEEMTHQLKRLKELIKSGG
jgi:hypothetical protein